MELSMRGGFTIPTKNDNWIKCDIEIKLNEQEILKPKSHRIAELVKKGITICEKQIGDKLQEVAEDIKNRIE